MGGLAKTGVVAHDNQVLILEGQRQVSVMAATNQQGATTAEITYWRGRKASAVTNGPGGILAAEVANAVQALLALGTGGI